MPKNTPSFRLDWRRGFHILFRTSSIHGGRRNPEAKDGIHAAWMPSLLPDGMTGIDGFSVDEMPTKPNT
ncbi:hypothetical protein [Methyloglobulus sp.]|uniref:hypothetical protein n=1 Tax=Methyloglobulus sp. TaxID=2518622 RepID=UPI003989EF65